MRRPNPTRAIALVVSCALLSTSLPAFAQGAPKAGAAKVAKPAKKKGLRDSLSGEARDAFDRGVQLYEGKNYEGAVAEFERAYSLSKDSRLLFNVAIAERDAKRYSRSVNRLEQQLKESGDSLTDAEKKTSQDLLEALKQFTAPLTIASNEADATVLIDGVDVGKTPLAKPVTVDVGERAVTVKKNGFLDAIKRVTISGGKAEKIDINLEAAQKKGHLSVKAINVPGATILVDGVEQGPSPWEGDVLADKHTIEIKARGFVTETRTEVVADKKTTTIELSLRPDEGKVRVETDKTENLINIDGKDVGRGTWEGTLPSGTHSLRVTRSGTDPHASQLVVQTDQLSKVQVTLRTKNTIPWYAWVIGGGIIVGGGVAAYVLTRPTTEAAQPGTIDPFTVKVNQRPGVFFF